MEIKQMSVVILDNATKKEEATKFQLCLLGYF